MRLKYTTRHPTQPTGDSLPRVPLVLRNGDRQASASALVDSGSTVNVLPYAVGLQLGFVWDDRKATLRLAGSLGNHPHPAQGIIVTAVIGEYTPVRLAFAWVKSDKAPLILGHTNFFQEFDVCFFSSQLEFEVRPKQ